MCVCVCVCVTCDRPEVALGGLDEADGGVLLVGVGGAQQGALAGQLLKLHTQRHRLCVGVQRRRHGALDAVCRLPGNTRQPVR